MNKIEKMIKEMCPNGVEAKKLGELLDYIQPTKYIVEEARYDDSYNTPVLTAGQTFILGYTNEENNIFKASNENPVMIFDDFTTSNHWVDFDFKVKSSALKILVPKLEFSFRFVYHCIKNIKFTPANHGRQWIQNYSNILIPFPPLDIQDEIVKILDTFTELEVELEAELEARKKQYKYYLKKSLYSECLKYEQYTIGQLSTKIFAGGDAPEDTVKINQENLDKKKYAVYSNGSGSKALYGYSDTYKIDETAIIIAARGTIGEHQIVREKFTPIIRLITLIPNNELVLIEYLNFLLDTVELQSSSGSIPQLTIPNIKSKLLKVPNLECQKKAIRILHQYEKLIFDINEGIPAEIEYRKKQYEYYRNKLLCFEMIERI